MGSEMCIRDSWYDAVLAAHDTSFPHFISNWAYHLATTYTAFNRDCRIIDSDAQASRICINHASLVAMHEALRLIGVEPVERM